MATLVIPEATLKYLDDLFPERCPGIDWTERQVWLAVGAREVVRHLKAMLAEQERNRLEQEMVHK